MLSSPAPMIVLALLLAAGTGALSGKVTLSGLAPKLAPLPRRSHQAEEGRHVQSQLRRAPLDAGLARGAPDRRFRGHRRGREVRHRRSASGKTTDQDLARTPR